MQEPQHAEIQTQRDKQRARFWLRIAVAFVTLPCLLGVLIFALWMLTRQPVLMTLGVVNLYLGVGLACVAMAALAAYVLRARKSPLVSGKRIFWSTAAVLGLLAGNFVVAGSIVFAAVEIETRYVVMIENHSESRFEEIELTGGGVTISLSAIPEGGEARAVLHFGADSDLRLRGRLDGTEQDVVLEGYVCSGLGGESHVVVLPDNTIQISHE